jgi:site-specific recombinase XerD
MNSLTRRPKETEEKSKSSSLRSSQLQGADLPLFVDMWLSDMELHLAPASHKTYQSAMGQFLSYWNKTEKPPVAPLLIKQYVRDLKWRRCSAAYVQRQLSVLRSFCAWAVDKNILPSNPAIKIPLPKLSAEYRKEALSKEEAGLLIKTLSYNDFYSIRDALLISLILGSGTRLIELHRASVGDYVRKEGIGLLYLQGKGREAADSFVVLMPEIAGLVERYLSIMKGPSPKDPMFTAQKPQKGARLSVRGIQKIITGYLKRAGVKRKRVTAYSLRHSAATLALQNGASLMAIGDMLRHKSISTTQRYEHLTRRIEDGAEHYVGIFQDSKKEMK